jgi:hypothetical protein
LAAALHGQLVRVEALSKKGVILLDEDHKEKDVFSPPLE